jgi:MFS family permease
MLSLWRRGLIVFYGIAGLAGVVIAIVIGLRTVGHSGATVLRDRLLVLAVLQSVATGGLVRQRSRRRGWRWPLVAVALIGFVVLAWTLAIEPALLTVITGQAIAVVLYLTSPAYLILSALPWPDEGGAQGRPTTGKKRGGHERSGLEP